MEIIADLHIHGRYSRATSKNLTIANLEKWAGIKGINLLGTGDFTHPKWFEDLKKNLEYSDGVLKTKNGFCFIPQTEISLIYTQGGRGRKVHNIVLAPDLEVATQITEALKKRGRVDYDGRPIFKIPCPEFVEMMQSISNKTEVIPAHAWTPYFGVFGSMSGFDSLKECFLDKANKIHAIETGLSCYDKETEVLTEGGWKKVSEIEYSDKIGSLNPDTYEIEFCNPTKIFRYRYKGKMYRLKTKRIDLFVTPNHNLFYRPCDFRNNKPYQLREAKLLFGKSKIFKKDAVWIGKKPKCFMLPAVQIKHGSRYYSGFRNKTEKSVPIKPWLKFFGFWLAEGWTTSSGDGGYATCVCNNNDNILDEMKQILESFGYTVLKRKNIIRVRDFQLFNYLKQFGKASEKFVPATIKSLSKELIGLLFDYYIKGDGHRYGRTRKGLSATTISIRLRDDLQEIALKLGISAYYRLHKKKGTPFASPSQKRVYLQTADSWVIYFIRRNQHTVLPSTIKKYNYIEKWENYDGLVYCVSVPNRVIYVRRNGIPVWCGNSDPPMNWRLSQLDRFSLVSFSDLHSFWPWRIGREATIFELKKISYDEILKALRNKGVASTIEVDPAYGKYHVDGHRNCGISLEPKEALKLNNICPVCKKPLTIGVLHRVEELADMEAGFKPKDAPAFESLIPLSEILSSVIGSALSSKKIWEVYWKLVKDKTELEVLRKTGLEELQERSNEVIAKTIIRFRSREIKIKPGYDGVYGVPILDNTNQTGTKRTKARQLKKEKEKQKGLDDF